MTNTDEVLLIHVIPQFGRIKPLQSVENGLEI